MIRNQLEMSRINAVRLFKHGTCQTAVGLTRASTPSYRAETWMAGTSPAMTRETAVSHQQIDQMRDQRDVRGRHRIIAQLVGADPGEVLSLARHHVSLPAPADIERH